MREVYCPVWGVLWQKRGYSFVCIVISSKLKKKVPVIWWVHSVIAGRFWKTLLVLQRWEKAQEYGRELERRSDGQRDLCSILGTVSSLHRICCPVTLKIEDIILVQYCSKDFVYIISFNMCNSLMGAHIVIIPILQIRNGSLKCLSKEWFVDANDWILLLHTKKLPWKSFHIMLLFLL